MEETKGGRCAPFVGVSSVCWGGGDHICDCEGDSSASLCEPREGPIFLPSHCTLAPRTGE